MGLSAAAEGGMRGNGGDVGTRDASRDGRCGRDLGGVGSGCRAGRREANQRRQTDAQSCRAEAGEGGLGRVAKAGVAQRNRRRRMITTVVGCIDYADNLSTPFQRAGS